MTPLRTNIHPFLQPFVSAITRERKKNTHYKHICEYKPKQEQKKIEFLCFFYFVFV